MFGQNAELKKLTKETKIQILKEEIRMILSHQNLSNKKELDEMIENRLRLIKKIESSCAFCEVQCDNIECFTKDIKGKD